MVILFGAKIVSNFKETGICSDVQAERLLAFTNNSGPLFIVGTIGISLFSSYKIGLYLLVTHILACLTVGFFFRWWKKDIKPGYNNQTHKPIYTTKNQFNLSTLGIALSSSISSALKSVVMIGGFVILFSVIISILNSSGFISIISNVFTPLTDILKIPANYTNSIITGIIEITNGISQIALPKPSFISIIIVSFILGFGGICVLLQVFSIVSKAKISIKPYILGKLLQGCISAFYMFLAMKLF